VTADGKSKRAIIYVRISRDDEGRALGVQRQEQDCLALTDRLGWTVVAVESDNDLSASSRSRKHRPAYERMLAAVDAGTADAVVSYSTSRLTRRPLEFEGLIARAEHGMTIATVAAGEVDLATANGRAIARTLAAFDAREAEENSERSKREREQRRERGRWNGGPRPFGWEPDGTTPRPEEHTLIRTACKDVLAGRSLAAIARQWNTATGKTMQSSSVGDILRNPRVAGMLPDGRPAQWAPIVPEDTWRGVVAVLADPARRRNRGPMRLLTGIAVCGLCGATINGGVTRTGAPTYRCSATKHLDRLAQPVDEYVREIVLHYLARERISAEPTGDTGALAQEAEALRARLNEAADLFAAGNITGQQLARTTATMTTALEAVEARMVAAMGTAALHGLPLTLDALRATWEGADVDRRRAILRAVGIQIAVDPPGRGVRRFDPDTVRIDWRTA